jgi:hypothetical protein
MSDLRIEYGELTGLMDEGRKHSGQREARRSRLRRPPFTMLKWALGVVVLAILPFAVLIRGGVFAYREWALETWPALALAVTVTTLFLAGYAWAFSRKVGAGKGMRWVLTRGAIAIAYSGDALVYIASANVKSEDIRSQYAAIHPLLRVAASSLILVDPSAVITDAGRSAEDYYAMGLAVNEASFHFEQEDGFVHALDLRTSGRPEWRNRAVEMAFWALDFHSLRHVGTVDHLHLSLRLPG